MPSQCPFVRWISLLSAFRALEKRREEMILNLHDRQFDVLDSEANEILYGGAAGGGKSYLLRAISVALCLDNPGLQVYLFRRNYPDLISNHMNGHMSYPEMLAKFVESGQAKINIGDFDIKFSNGSAIHGRHCQHESDVTKYQGAEIHVLLMDELTHFSEYQYRFLRSRVRLGGTKVKPQWKNKLPCIISASNPGSIGHAWVKRSFIDMAPEYEIKTMALEEGGMKRQFIPAKLADNPTLTENDPLYETRLSGLGSPELVKAMLDGNWDIVAGAAFEKLSRSTHQIRKFKIPDYWTKFTSIDWGTAKPYANGWFCVPDEDVVLKSRDGHPEKIIPKNSIIMYRELYGWNGKPDEGCRQESWQVAQKMLAIEYGLEDIIPDIDGGKNMQYVLQQHKGPREKIDYRIGDSAMWAQHDGPSVAENFALNGVNLEQSTKDRSANYLEARRRIAPPDGQPGFYITENCLHFWRTVPELQLDERQPEKGPDTRQEDHSWDSVAYALVSRPTTWTANARTRGDYEESRRKSFEADRKSGGNKTGRYS